MSLWQRLRAALRPIDPRAKDAGVTPPRKQAPAPAATLAGSGDDDAQRIYTYTRRIGPLDERLERCDPEILAALTRLWQSGHEGQAVALGGSLASALPHDAQLQLAVAELLCVQRDYRQAAPLLQRALAAAPAGSEPQLRARFLLHEAALASDATEEALEHLRQLLAADFFYPAARARLAAVQARKGLAAGGPLMSERLRAPAVAAGPAGLVAPTLLGVPGAAPERYKLLRELGCGSAGTVYLALDAELACELALKVFHPRLFTAGAPALLRALHEARLLSAVRHPGVIALYDLGGELPADTDTDAAAGPGRGLPHLAMELCRGGSLRDRLRGGPLPLAAVLLRATELLDTLVAVHRTGIVHGDIKPENLLFRGPGVHRSDLPASEAALGDLVLSDFGLARLGENEDAASRGGTFGYLAPERLRGAAATPASDLYAAAAVLCEMLAGAPAPTHLEALTAGEPRTMLSAPDWLERIAAFGAAGPPLQRLLAACLLPEPAARPTAAAAFEQLTALRAPFLAGPDV